MTVADQSNMVTGQFGNAIHLTKKEVCKFMNRHEIKQKCVKGYCVSISLGSESQWLLAMEYWSKLASGQYCK